jgi:hypothetical protein
MFGTLFRNASAFRKKYNRPEHPGRQLQYLIENLSWDVLSAKGRKIMRRVALFAIAAGFVVPLMASAPAHAQATRTWVSGVGDDANPCSRTAPCKTFQGAVSKTATGGIMNCMDDGGFGAVTLTKNMTIDCTPHIAGVLAGPGNGIVVNGAGVTVVLRGLNIEGSPGTGQAGVNIIAAAAVHIQHCNISQFQTGNASAVRVVTTSGSPKIYITDSYIHDNGLGGVGGGVISGATGGSALITVYNTKIENNTQGLANNVNTRTRIANSVISGNTVGIEADAGAQVTIGNTDLNFNGTALSGAVTSFGNNRFAGNVSDGTAPTAAGGASTDLGQK